MKVDVPPTVGVPEITAFTGSKLRPCGRLPAVIDHEYVPVGVAFNCTT